MIARTVFGRGRPRRARKIGDYNTVIVRHSGRVAYRVVQHDRCSIYFLDMHPTPPTSPSAQPWLKSDLLFLSLSLENGMPIPDVAGFLARNEDEVREKAEELRRSAPRKAIS
jgi:hypothetical protein